MDANQLRAEVTYNPETGLFYRIQTKRRRNIGSPIGQKTEYGYIRIRLSDGKRHMAHRLAFLYMTGNWPPDQMDHINRVRDDNRWCNLRPASRIENNRNVAGLGIERRSENSYRARITVDHAQITIGHYPTAEMARQAYLETKARLHGVGKLIESAA